MPAAPLTSDKPLNARQERFAQAYASGMSGRDAAKAAGYRSASIVWDLMTKPNIARRIEQMTARTAAASGLTAEVVNANLRDIAERNQRAESVSGQDLSRRSWMNLARMNGMMNPKPASAGPPAREPITEIRRIIVYPDGYTTDYNGNPPIRTGRPTTPASATVARIGSLRGQARTRVRRPRQRRYRARRPVIS